MITASSPDGPVLRVCDVTVRFGGLTALADVTLALQAGARHGILGPNGAGKTSLFNVITGAITPVSGRVLIAGIDATHLAPHQRIGLGLGRTFQITSLFPTLTALENVLMSALVGVAHHRNVWRSARHDREAMALARSLLETMGLADLTHSRVHDLSYGEQRQLEIAVALALRPRILLLDEPTAGLSAIERHMVHHLLKRLPAALTVLVIEHNLEVMFDLADMITVFHEGKIVTTGPAADIRIDPVVKAVYFG